MSVASAGKGAALGAGLCRADGGLKIARRLRGTPASHASSPPSASAAAVSTGPAAGGCGADAAALISATAPPPPSCCPRRFFFFLTCFTTPPTNTTAAASPSSTNIEAAPLAQFPNVGTSALFRAMLRGELAAAAADAAAAAAAAAEAGDCVKGGLAEVVSLGVRRLAAGSSASSLPSCVTALRGRRGRPAVGASWGASWGASSSAASEAPARVYWESGFINSGLSFMPWYLDAFWAPPHERCQTHLRGY